MMNDIMIALEAAYSDYRNDLAVCEKKQKPADGLFGLGTSIKDAPCHEQLDERIAAIVQQAADEGIGSQQAAQAIRLLFTQTSLYPYPTSAQWMLYATERHGMALVPFLTGEDAAELSREYEKRYKPWNRLPVQKTLCRALKQQSKG